MVPAHLAFHLLQEFAPKLFTAELPASAKQFQTFRIIEQTTSFHNILKLPSARHAILHNSHLTEQAVDSSQTSPSVVRNRLRPSSSLKIGSRRSPRFMTWQIAPGYCTRNFLAMAPKAAPLRSQRQ
jgi:hypothetical protein